MKYMTFNHNSDLTKLKWLLIVFVLLIMPDHSDAQNWKWIAVGDTRGNRPEYRQVLEAIMANTPDYTFIINMGDVVDHGDVESEWEDWYETTTGVLGDLEQDQFPPGYMSAPGNHDATETEAGLANWNEYLPGQNKLFANDGKFLVFDYRNARIVVMDSDESPMNGPQYDMMLKAIRQNPKTWLFTVWHHPIFDFGEKSYEDEIHDLWGIPLYQAGCDIMFMGHAHYYVRTKKLALNGEMNPPLDMERGTVQVVTGNGGAPIDIPEPDHDGNGYMVEACGTDSSHYGYTELSVGPDTLCLRHYLRDGSLLDEAYYTPNPKSANPVNNPRNDTNPENFQLMQNYPNPFNASTQIQFTLSENSWIELNIYDVRGRLIDTPVKEFRQAGNYQIEWNMNPDDHQVPAGLYIYRLKSGDLSRIRKMLVIP